MVEPQTVAKSTVSLFASGGLSTLGLALQGGRGSEGRAEGEMGIVGAFRMREGEGTDGLGGPAAWHNKGMEAVGPGLETPSVDRDRKPAGPEAGGGLDRAG